MRLLINLVLFIILSTPAWSATWYIRSDGGTYGTTSTTCNGLYNMAYSAGNGPNCAVKSVYEIWQYVTDDASGRGGTTRFSGGDTVYFSKSGDSFPIGANRSSTPSGCSSSYPYGCYLTAPPSGTDSAHPTKIVGYGYDTGCTGTKVQLYGVQSVKSIFKMSSVSNINFECLEITDHSDCMYAIGNHLCATNYPADVGDYGRDAFVVYGGSNLVFKNLDIHGMAYRAFLMGGQTNITMSYVNTDGNADAGWDGDVGHSGESYIQGTILIDHVKVRFNGCNEAYPRSANFNTADYAYCTDQNFAGTPGYGDGWGYYTVGGNWYIRNSEFSHNVSDGLDLLYGDGTNSLYVDKSLFEGNTGNQLKFKGLNLQLTNSVLIANCDYITNAGKAATGGITDCRANGTPLSLISMLGSNFQIYNNTTYSATNTAGSPFAEWDYNGTCNGTETYNISNNIGYSPNHTWSTFYSGMSGACQTAFASRTVQYNNIYNFSDNPSGTGNVYTNPTFASALVNTADSNLSNMYIQVSSPAKGAGTTGLTYWNSSTDYNNYRQNSPIDAGGIQYGSVGVCYANGSFCSASSDCCSGFCNALNACATPGSYLYNITPTGSIKFQ